MLSVERANEISGCTIRHKSLRFRLCIAWMCGRIEQKIRKAAEYGECYVWCKFPIQTSVKYFPALAWLLEEYGYYVWYQLKGDKNKIGLGVCWNLDKMTASEGKLINNSTYHTPSGIKKLGENYTAEDISKAIESLRYTLRSNYQANMFEILRTCGEQIVYHMETGLPMDFRQEENFKK